MRVLNIILISFILTLFVSGCSNISKVPSGTRSSRANELGNSVKTSNDKPLDVDANLQNNTTDGADNNSEYQEIINNNQITEDFYGKWIIKRQVAFGRISSLSDEEINNFIGKRIEYSRYKASFEDDICNNPLYKKSTLSEKDFFDNSGYTRFDRLGLQGNNVVMVEVFNGKDDFSYYWHGIGGKFFIKDKNTLIVNWGGVFFEMTRDE